MQQENAIYAHKDNKIPMVKPFSANNTIVPKIPVPQLHQTLPSHGSTFIWLGKYLDDR